MLRLQKKTLLLCPCGVRARRLRLGGTVSIMMSEGYLDCLVVLQVASDPIGSNLSTAQNKWISIDSAIKEPQERDSRHEHTDSHSHDAEA